MKMVMKSNIGNIRWDYKQIKWKCCSITPISNISISNNLDILNFSNFKVLEIYTISSVSGSNIGINRGPSGIINN